MDQYNKLLKILSANESDFDHWYRYIEIAFNLRFVRDIGRLYEKETTKKKKTNGARKAKVSKNETKKRRKA